MESAGKEFADRLRGRLETAASRRQIRRASGLEPELCYGRHRGPATVDARSAAVLVLFYPFEGRWHIPLTLRPAHLSAHAGQVSFPGGSVDAGETSEQCALRELQEELGVSAEAVSIVGRLSTSFIYASGFCVEPFVGVACEHSSRYQ